MLIIRGVTVFPGQSEDVLLRIEGIEPHYQIVVDRQHGAMDDLEVQIEVAPEIFADKMAGMVEFTERVSDRLFSVLGLHAKLTLVEPGMVERTVGKAKRVIDRRCLD
jgi:phenylacetate-CoA ligase